MNTWRLGLGMTMSMEAGEMERETMAGRVAPLLQDGRPKPLTLDQTMALAIADMFDAIEVALVAFGDEKAIAMLHDAQDRYVDRLHGKR